MLAPGHTRYLTKVQKIRTQALPREPSFPPFVCRLSVQLVRIPDPMRRQMYDVLRSPFTNTIVHVRRTQREKKGRQQFFHVDLPIVVEGFRDMPLLEPVGWNRLSPLSPKRHSAPFPYFPSQTSQLRFAAGSPCNRQIVERRKESAT
jgi:hypothetical protein